LRHEECVVAGRPRRSAGCINEARIIEAIASREPSNAIPIGRSSVRSKTESRPVSLLAPTRITLLL